MSVNNVAGASVKLPSNPRTTGATSEATKGPKATAEAEKLTRAAGEFEAVFMRQILKTAKFGGKTSDSGYGGMIIDALATGVTQNGGMGLAKSISDSLLRQDLKAATLKLPHAALTIPHAALDGGAALMAHARKRTSSTP